MNRHPQFQFLRPATVFGIAVLAVGLVGCGETAEPATDQTEQVATFPATNRPDVRGTKGAVSSGHPLATAAGMAVLKDGGNAVDAAVAMAGVLAVVRPHMNGIGGDAFALIYEASTGEVHALNGSGRSGTRATPEFFTDQGLEDVPETGPLSVSVPGTVAAWETALDRFGTRGLSELLEPAIEYADDGFPVSTRLASDIEAMGQGLNEPGSALYLPGGSPPAVGSLLRNQALAQSLREIASSGSQWFYHGAGAVRMAAFVDSLGGTLSEADFGNHRTDWVESLRASVLGHELHAMPPNTQGMAQLSYAVMAEQHDLAALGHNSDEYLHRMIELKKLAFADRNDWASDPEFTTIPMGELLSHDYLVERAGLIESTANPAATAGIPSVPPAAEGDLPNDNGDTVYLTVVDQWGNAVSWIQSLFHGFGSGLLEPETGIVLHNRGSLYTLQEGHPNQVAPGKRPYHTLSPLLALTPSGDLGFTLGTPGGDSQPQSLLQIMNNLLLFGMTPQAAIEAPRFRSYPGLSVDIESRVAADIRAALEARGHDMRVVDGWTAVFGGAQMIFVESSGTLTVASDPRREAYGLAH